MSIVMRIIQSMVDDHVVKRLMDKGKDMARVRELDRAGEHRSAVVLRQVIHTRLHFQPSEAEKEERRRKMQAELEAAFDSEG